MNGCTILITQLMHWCTITIMRLLSAEHNLSGFFYLSFGLWYFTGLDTNGCPLGNSKFTLLSDNLNICQWLSACQVEKIYQNQIQIDTNVDNPTSDLDVIYDFNQFNPNCFWFILKTKWFCWKALFTPVLVVVKSVFPQLATTLSGDTTIILGIVCKVLFSCLFPKTQNDKAVRLPKMR